VGHRALCLRPVFGIEHHASAGTTFAGTTTVLTGCKAPATDPHWTDAAW